MTVYLEAHALNGRANSEDPYLLTGGVLTFIPEIQVSATRVCVLQFNEQIPPAGLLRGAERPSSAPPLSVLSVYTTPCYSFTRDG